MHKYHINVFYSKPDEGFVADVPDLLGCSAFGKTPHEALQNVVEAMERWMETAKANGEEIPVPQYKPAIYR